MWEDPIKDPITLLRDIRSVLINLIFYFLIISLFGSMIYVIGEALWNTWIALKV